MTIHIIIIIALFVGGIVFAFTEDCPPFAILGFVFAVAYFIISSGITGLIADPIHIPCQVSVTKTPSAVIVEGLVKDRIVRTIYTDITSYHNVDKPGYKWVYEYKVNAYGMESDGRLVMVSEDGR